MTIDVAEDRYSLSRLVSILGVSRKVVLALVDAGHVQPSRSSGTYRFTFQDLVVLRAATALTPRRTLASLRRLRAKLPTEPSTPGLQLKAFGDDLAVKGVDGGWETASGQLLMDFGGPASDTRVHSFENGPTLSKVAADWFREGEHLEAATDLAAAERAYRSALQLAPDHVDAYLNLGVMLCEAKRCAEAAELYRAALDLAPEEPLLHFNAAIAFEDLKQDRAALTSYERCLELMPDLADAHYNAAQLYERRGDKQRALRHFSAYRRLQKTDHTDPKAR